MTKICRNDTSTKKQPNDHIHYSYVHCVRDIAPLFFLYLFLSKTNHTLAMSFSGNFLFTRRLLSLPSLPLLLILRFIYIYVDAQTHARARIYGFSWHICLFPRGMGEILHIGFFLHVQYIPTLSHLYSAPSVILLFSDCTNPRRSLIKGNI